MTCYKCNKTKAESDFYPSSLRKQDYRCKPCSVKSGKADRLARIEQDRTHERFRYAKHSSKSNKKPFHLTLDQYRELVNKPCHYCGIQDDDNGIGLDRIDNDKAIGYTVDNVLACCTNCNRIRGAVLTVKETEIAIRAVLEYRAKLTI